MSTLAAEVYRSPSTLEKAHLTFVAALLCYNGLVCAIGKKMSSFTVVLLVIAGYNQVWRYWLPSNSYYSDAIWLLTYDVGHNGPNLGLNGLGKVLHSKSPYSKAELHGCSCSFRPFGQENIPARLPCSHVE